MKQRAFVRYTKAGKIVPGSMIVTQGSYPDGPALWAEVVTDLCCDDSAFTTTSRLKGFVRYTQSGNIVPGSLVIGETYPKGGGLWRDVTINLCCDSAPNIYRICTDGGYWFNTIYSGPVEGRDVLSPYDMSLDNLCNVYSLQTGTITGGELGGQANIYSKFSSSGSLIWQVADQITDDITANNEGAYQMRISPSGNLFVLYDKGLRKINPNDGSVVWEYFWDGVDFKNYGIDFDSNGNIFLYAMTGGNIIPIPPPPDFGKYVILVKLSESTGAILAKTKIDNNFLDRVGIYTNTSPLIDNQNNVIINISGERISDGEYSAITIKLNNSLSSVLWSSVVEKDDFPGDCDLTGFGIDAVGNIYGNNYGNSIFKLTRNGQFVWGVVATSEFQSMYNLAISPSGDVYWCGSDLYSSIDGTKQVVLICKFNSNGQFQWSIALSSSSTDDLSIGGWASVNEGVRFENGVLLLALYSQFSPNKNDYLVKLNPDGTTNGTFDDLQFTDVSGIMSTQFSPVVSTVSSPTITLSSTNEFTNLRAVTTISQVYTPTITNTILS